MIFKAEGSSDPVSRQCSSASWLLGAGATSFFGVMALSRTLSGVWQQPWLPTTWDNPIYQTPTPDCDRQFHMPLAIYQSVCPVASPGRCIPKAVVIQNPRLSLAVTANHRPKDLLLFGHASCSVWTQKSRYHSGSECVIRTDLDDLRLLCSWSRMKMAVSFSSYQDGWSSEELLLLFWPSHEASDSHVLPLSLWNPTFSPLP